MSASLARCRAGDLPVLTEPEADILAHLFRSEIPVNATGQAYARAFVRFLEGLAGRGVSRLADLTTAMAHAYFRELAEDRAPATVQQHLAGVNRCLDCLARAGAIDTNPVRSVRGPRPRSDPPTPLALDQAALTKMLRLIPDDLLGLRDRSLITLLLFTGARISALLELDVAAIHRQNGTTHVTLSSKGGEARTLPLPAEAAVVLETYLAAAGIEAGAIFRSSGWPRKVRTRLGEARLTRNGAWRRLQFLARAAGIAPPTCQAFRGMALTGLSRAGLGLEALRQFAGHRSAETTRAYMIAAKTKPERPPAGPAFHLPPPALRQPIPARRALRRLLAPWLRGNTLTVPHDELKEVAARLGQSPPAPGAKLRLTELAEPPP